MKLTYALTAAVLALAAPVQAHEVWVERDAGGPARIYLGEPGEALPEGGDPEFHNLKAPRLVPASDAAQRRDAGFIEVAVPEGDVRLIDDNVFEPWEADGKKEAVIYYARAGRADTRSLLPLEIAPVEAGGQQFVLLRDGKPVAENGLTVITPEKWSKTFTTDAEGRLDVPVREKGRYILTAAVKEEGDLKAGGQPVGAIHHITTTTFVVE